MFSFCNIQGKLHAKGQNNFRTDETFGSQKLYLIYLAERPKLWLFLLDGICGTVLMAALSALC